MVFVGVDAAALAGPKIEAWKSEILAWRASIKTPATCVDGGATVVGDDGIFITFYSRDNPIIEDKCNLYIT